MDSFIKYLNTTNVFREDKSAVQMCLTQNARPIQGQSTHNPLCGVGYWSHEHVGLMNQRSHKQIYVRMTIEDQHEEYSRMQLPLRVDQMRWQDNRMQSRYDNWECDELTETCGGGGKKTKSAMTDHTVKKNESPCYSRYARTIVLSSTNQRRQSNQGLKMQKCQQNRTYI